MPIHFSDLDVTSKVDDVNSALIVPCIMCPAATVAIREQKPLLQLFKSLFKSAPLERYLAALRARLAEEGVRTEVFKSRLYHQWFMCMWTAGRREQLRKRAERHDAVIVLGCDSATKTVRDEVEASGCKVIEGMKVTGIMNAHLSLSLSGKVSFESCKIVPIAGHRQDESVVH